MVRGVTREADTRLATLRHRGERVSAVSTLTQRGVGVSMVVTVSAAPRGNQTSAERDHSLHCTCGVIISNCCRVW